MRNFLKSANIRLLDDETVLIDKRFYLTGRKDPSRCRKMSDTRKDPDQLTACLDKTLPIIFMDHQPGQLDEVAAAGADLDLCGHTHDGQLFPLNIITGLVWENSCGYLKKGTMHNIVTSGAGIWGPNMRTATNSEICSITVHFLFRHFLLPFQSPSETQLLQPYHHFLISPALHWNHQISLPQYYRPSFLLQNSY